MSVLSLCVIFIGCSKSSDSTSTPPPTVSFTWQSSSLTAPSTVTFTNTSTGATSYSWDFGDGSTSIYYSPSHVFNSAGTYTVTLTATGEGGTNQYSQTITVSASSGGVIINKIMISAITNQPSYSNNTFSGILAINYVGSSSWLYTSPIFTNVAAIPANSVTFSTGSSLYTIAGFTPTSVYDIHLQQYGASGNTDLGFVGFIPNDYVSTHPTTVALNNNGTTMTLLLTWL